MLIGWLEVNGQETQGSTVAGKLIDAANAPDFVARWLAVQRATGTVQLRLA